MENQNFTIHIDNLKCGGCANSIRKGLSKIEGVETVDVDLERSAVSVSGTVQKPTILDRLSSMGYPEQGTTNLMQTAKSFVSCAIGRMSAEQE